MRIKQAIRNRQKHSAQQLVSNHAAFRNARESAQLYGASAFETCHPSTESGKQIIRTPHKLQLAAHHANHATHCTIIDSRAALLGQVARMVNAVLVLPPPPIGHGSASA